MHQPVIILVNPQMGENIGATARAMMNFGLSELRLVAPRDGWPNQKAFDMAVHATPILESAKLYNTTREAAADLQHVYATTARGRDMVKRAVTPPEAMHEIIEAQGQGIKTGILFGPERTGLTNEDVALANTILTIPTAPDNASLNIAQSVVITAYEWFRAAAGEDAGMLKTTSPLASPVNPDKFSPPASRDEIEGFFDHLERLLDQTHFFKTEEIKPKMWRGLRSLFIRASMNEQEVRTMRGVLKALENK